MEKEIDKEELSKLIKMNGEVRGVALKSHADFILQQKGQIELDKLENILVELGYPIKFKEIKTWDFYPIGIEIIEMLTIKNLFNFEDKKFEEIGTFGSVSSFIMKLFMRYFGSIKMVAKEAPSIWKKYYTIGELKVKELNEKERYIILDVENFFIHPLHCFHLKGFFSSVVQMVTKTNPSCEETKCVHRGDSFHEFVIKW